MKIFIKERKKQKIKEAFVRTQVESIFKKYPEILDKLEDIDDEHDKIVAVFKISHKNEKTAFNGTTSKALFQEFGNLSRAKRQLKDLEKAYQSKIGNNPQKSNVTQKVPTLKDTDEYTVVLNKHISKTSQHSVFIPFEEQSFDMRDEWGFIGKRILLDLNYKNNRIFKTYDPRFDLVYFNGTQRAVILDEIEKWKKDQQMYDFDIHEEELILPFDYNDVTNVSRKVSMHGYFYVSKIDNAPIKLLYRNKKEINTWINEKAQWLKNVDMKNALIIVDGKSLEPIQIHNAIINSGEIKNIGFYDTKINGGSLYNTSFFINSVMNGGDFINGSISTTSIVNKGNIINSNLYGTMNNGVFNGGTVSDSAVIKGGVFLGGHLDNPKDILLFSNDIPNFVIIDADNVDSNLYYNRFIIINDKKSLFNVLDTMKPREQSLINSDDGFILLNFEKKFMNKDLPEFLYQQYEDSIDSGDKIKDRMRLKYGFLIPRDLLNNLEHEFDNKYTSKNTKTIFNKYVVLPYSFAYDYFE